LTNIVLAKRYARALFSIGKETGELKDFFNDLSSVNKFLLENPEINIALSSPIFPLAEKKNIVSQMDNAFGFKPSFSVFLGLLIERGRVGLMDQIFNTFQEFMDDEMGIVRARVKSAVTLSGELDANLSDVLSKIAGKKVEVELQEDPSIIAGMVVSMGDKVWDGSLRNQLDNIRQSLMRGEIR
jgi:F-type H+-transporting ATPase subunit delta